MLPVAEFGQRHQLGDDLLCMARFLSMLSCLSGYNGWKILGMVLAMHAPFFAVRRALLISAGLIILDLTWWRDVRKVYTT